MTAKTRRCITVLYPNKPGVTFNFDYYRDHHATLIERLYGEGIAKIESQVRGVSDIEVKKLAKALRVHFSVLFP